MTASSILSVGPLTKIRSIKTKWSIVIVAAVAVTAFMSQLGLQLGWPVWVRPMVAGALALVMVQFLAKGMTRPLRQMADAANAMSAGEAVEPIEVTSNDEVGQLATAFNSMALDLAESDRHQRDFVANASHELRTPVAALRSTLENLVDGVGTPDRRTLSLMLAQAEHLGTLVSQLLDLSRLDAGADAHPLEPVDLGDLLHDVASHSMLLRPDVPVDVRAALGLTVVGNPARLEQLFTNLVANAARFTPPGERVTVVAGPRANAGRQRARISVGDAGPGIPDAIKDEVFRRFWQADTPTALDQPSVSSGGAGLGLSIAERIVATHRGTIEIADREPRGTTMIVELPLP